MIKNPKKYIGIVWQRSHMTIDQLLKYYDLDLNRGDEFNGRWGKLLDTCSDNRDTGYIEYVLNIESRNI